MYNKNIDYFKDMISRFSRKIVSSPYSRRPVRFYSTEIVGVFSAVQHGLQFIHDTTSLPYWQTIALSTVALRISLFPLLRFQVASTQQLSKAVPDIHVLYGLLLNRLSGIPKSDTPARMNAIGVFFSGVRATLTLNDVSITRIILWPIINIGIFATFVLSIRDMVIHGPELLGLANDGFGMFKDLTDKDSRCILPLAAAALSYTGLEISMNSPSPPSTAAITDPNQNKNKFFFRLKDVLQSLLILSLPFILELPVGVFCYWIPSSTFMIAQSLLLRHNPAFRKLLFPSQQSK
jgi:YidC/Oxa1 family membrane protein insertase